MAVIEIDLSSAGNAAPAVVGDEVVVSLDETPTSGYRWALEAFDEAVVAPLEDAFTPPEPGLLGGAGQHRFRFAVVSPGQALCGWSCAGPGTQDPWLRPSRRRSTRRSRLHPNPTTRTLSRTERTGCRVPTKGAGRVIVGQPPPDRLDLQWRHGHQVTERVFIHTHCRAAGAKRRRRTSERA